MADPAIYNIKDADNNTVTFTPNSDPAKGAKQDAAITALTAIVAKLIVAPATAAAQTTIIGHVDGIETALASVLSKLIASPSTEAKQDVEIASVKQVGTRAYGTATARQPYTGTSAASAAITGTEVLLHNCGTARCYVKAAVAPVATSSDIPMEPGEKFHLRITTGDKIAVIQDSTSGNLNIIPVI